MVDPIPAWQIQDAAVKARLRGATFGVLIALLNFRQEALEIHVSIDALAKRTGYCERQVKRAVRALDAGGWIIRTYEPEFHSTPKYVVRLPVLHK